jgi:hypothetical protein
MFDVTIEGESELVGAWVNVRSAVRGGMRRGVDLGCREGAAEARSRHAFKNRTGKLEKSIRGGLTGSSETEQTGEIVASEEHASFVENGTPAHEIRARNAPYLVFEWKGRIVRTKSVNHPGTRPLPFMGLAYHKAEAVIIRETEVGVAFAQQILDR